MATELQARPTWRRGGLGADGLRLRLTLHRRNLTRRRSKGLALLYGRCFSRIRFGARKEIPALIQVDCRDSSPLAAVRRISRACARVGRGDLIELLTTDLAAVAAALSWCKTGGGRIERMESASGAYVLDISTAEDEGLPGQASNGPER